MQKKEKKWKFGENDIFLWWKKKKYSWNLEKDMEII